MLDPTFQGYAGIAHGGIVMMLLDEVMAHASGMVGEKGMTASIAVRFRKPVPVGIELTLRGEVKWQRRRVLALEGSVSDARGDILATSEGSFVTSGKLEKPIGSIAVTEATTNGGPSFAESTAKQGDRSEVGLVAPRASVGGAQRDRSAF